MDSLRSRADGPARDALQDTGPLQSTRALFLALAIYLLSQVFTIPVVPIGPWALWPTLSDGAFLLIGLIWMLNPRVWLTAPSIHWSMMLRLLQIVLLGVCSYTALVVLAKNIYARQLWDGSSMALGGFGLARLLQFTLLFWMAAVVPMSAQRVQLLRLLTAAILVVVSAVCVATYLSWVNTSDLSSWLPSSLEVAGPWASYREGFLTGEGVGAVGYNHGYTALQILLLLGLVLQLSGETPHMSDYPLVLVAVIAIFVSGSRVGLLASGVMILGWAAARPLKERLLAGLGAAAIVVATIGILGQPRATSVRGDLLDRQLSALAFYDPSNLAGRTTFWTGVIDHLNDQPLRWLVGMGFGAATETLGANAHMLALQVLLETGMIGLVFIGAVLVGLLRLLYSQMPHNRSFFWVTVALLITSFSQETLYPVPAFGHFGGFYLAALAISLRTHVNQTHITEPL